MNPDLLAALPGVGVIALGVLTVRWRRRVAATTPPAGWPRDPDDPTEPPADWDPPTLDGLVAAVRPSPEVARVMPPPALRCRCGYMAMAWSVRADGHVHIEHLLPEVADCYARVCPGDCGALATLDGDPCGPACAAALDAAAAAGSAVTR
jgi:hypothetical protein